MLSQSANVSMRRSPLVRHARCFAAKMNPFEEVGQFPNHSNKVNPPANVCSSWVKNTDTDAMFNNPHLKKRYIPMQLRQTGDGKGLSGEGGLEGKGSRMLIDCRTRKGPYW